RRAPTFEFNRKLAPVKFSDQVQQLQQANRVRWSTPDVESMSRELRHVFLGQQKCVDKVLDKQKVAHLFAIPVNRDRFPGDRTNHEMRHPTLVLVAILVGTVNAAHAEDE